MERGSNGSLWLILAVVQHPLSCTVSESHMYVITDIWNTSEAQIGTLTSAEAHVDFFILHFRDQPATLATQ